MTRKYLLDTGRASDFVNDRGDVKERVCRAVNRGIRVGIAIPVLAELLAGIEFGARRDENRKKLFRAVGTLRLWSFDERAAEEYGRLYAALRRKGRPMQQNDIQIAAIALTLPRCTVVSTDSDLAAIAAISGLKVESWA